MFGPDRKNLGKTPLTLEWPMSSKPVVFELRLRGYRDRTAEVAVTANTITRVDPVRIPVRNPGVKQGSGGHHDDGNGLERPE